MTFPLVRAATQQDIAKLVMLYQEFHAFHVAGVPERLRVPEQYDIPRIQTTLAEYIQRPDIGLFVAQQDTELLGFVEVHVREDPMDAAVVHHRYGHVQSLMVAAQHRRFGIGRALLQAAKAWTTAQGIFQLRLEIWEFEAGPFHFYERLGFYTAKREMVIDTRE